MHNAGSAWITVLARNTITISHLYTCITETAVLERKHPGKVSRDKNKIVQIFLILW